MHNDADRSDAPDDVLQLADKFLKRRRAQLDSAVIDNPHAGLGSDDVDDDIPLLTEVVPTTATGDPAPSQPTPLPPLSMSSLNADIARALDAWLDEHLPQVIARAMDGVTDQLIQHIHQNAERELLPRLNRALRGASADGDDRFID